MAKLARLGGKRVLVLVDPTARLDHAVLMQLLREHVQIASTASAFVILTCERR